VPANRLHYVGKELDLFALAANWKDYVKTAIGEYLSGDVLEVGAGIGGTTSALHDGMAKRWICLEPDPIQAGQLSSMARICWGTSAPSVVVGEISALSDRPCFDCILYIDVLEHISDDRGQITLAAKRVRNGGHIIVLSPAHRLLFSEFDKSIGHLRRYNKRQLRSLMPLGWVEEKLMYLDSVGLLLSLGNAIALRKSIPSRLQILIWDRMCIPISRILDRVLLGQVGKSVLAVWKRRI
jgi:hypothetical protein